MKLKHDDSFSLSLFFLKYFHLFFSCFSFYFVALRPQVTKLSLESSLPTIVIRFCFFHCFYFILIFSLEFAYVGHKLYCSMDYSMLMRKEISLFCLSVCVCGKHHSTHPLTQGNERGDVWEQSQDRNTNNAATALVTLVFCSSFTHNHSCWGYVILDFSK